MQIVHDSKLFLLVAPAQLVVLARTHASQHLTSDKVFSSSIFFLLSCVLASMGRLPPLHVLMWQVRYHIKTRSPSASASFASLSNACNCG